uniref:Uncharacterized protein n=1 Tax=Vitrella brassicaformis TaxID=1169539 RepID=A0A7S1KBC1_9ALVE
MLLAAFVSERSAYEVLKDGRKGKARHMSVPILTIIDGSSLTRRLGAAPPLSLCAPSRQHLTSNTESRSLSPQVRCLFRANATQKVGRARKTHTAHASGRHMNGKYTHAPGRPAGIIHTHSSKKKESIFSLLVSR